MKKQLTAAVMAAMLCTGAVYAADTTGAVAVPAQQPKQIQQAQQTAQQQADQTTQPSQQTYSLDLDVSDYAVDTMQYEGKSVVFRAYENKVYVAHPVDTTYQSMNIYVPEEYFEGKSVHGYTAQTAPIFLPNTVGGYMPGKAGQPSEYDQRQGGPNAILAALARGCVVAAPGARGRTNQAADGTYTGKAPALIIDMKAAIRYLRHNKGVIPGDTEKIISNGTSAGGALSALIGATGNSKEYEPYLKALGAADERDDIFASSDYCPITDLEHADMAYEWVFGDVTDYHQNNAIGAMPAFLQAGGQTIPMGPGPVVASPGSMDSNNQNMLVMDRPDDAPAEEQKGTEMSDQQKAVSAVLRKAFPAYVNSLHLTAPDGTALTLDKNGEGTFKDYIKKLYMKSAQTVLDSGTDLSGMDWLIIQSGTVTDMDLGKYAVYATRLKAAPAFDALDLSAGENSEFGSETINARHFTSWGKKYNTAGKAYQADSKLIHLLNPLYFIGKKDVTTAPHWRIRHGSKDRDTSLVVPAILALRLQQTGHDVDFAVPWNRGHAGDYDLDELFAWIDTICGNTRIVNKS